MTDDFVGEAPQALRQQKESSHQGYFVLSEVTWPGPKIAENAGCGL